VSKTLLIVSCIYNNQPLVKQCYEAVLQNTDTENLNCYYVLVNNHSLDERAWEYLQMFTESRPGFQICKADPGSNLGCHRGFNYGVNYAKFYLNIKPDYIVKLDDDTVVPPHWNKPMMKILDDNLNLAYLSSVDQNAKLGSNFKVEKVGGYHIEIPRPNYVGFSCVMFPARTMDKYGLLLDRATLYGDEESDYSRRVAADGLYGAYIKEVVAQHLSNADRDTDYVAWKYWYGLARKTTKDLTAFKADKKELIACWEHMAHRPEQWWRDQAAIRLAELKKPWWKRIGSK
jgi:glycosyltransferase involved in cell wall biosynthesis